MAQGRVERLHRAIDAFNQGDVDGLLKHLDPGIETVFLMADEEFAHVSSTLIKQIAQLGPASGTDSLEAFVPSEVIEPLRAKFRDPAESVVGR